METKEAIDAIVKEIRETSGLCKLDEGFFLIVKKTGGEPITAVAVVRKGGVFPSEIEAMALAANIVSPHDISTGIIVESRIAPDDLIHEVIREVPPSGDISYKPSGDG